MKATFVVVGLFVSIVQAAVAHANWYARDNVITDMIRNIYGKIGR